MKPFYNLSTREPLMLINNQTSQRSCSLSLQNSQMRLESLEVLFSILDSLKLQVERTKLLSKFLMITLTAVNYQLICANQESHLLKRLKNVKIGTKKESKQDHLMPKDMGFHYLYQNLEHAWIHLLVYRKLTLLEMFAIVILLVGLIGNSRTTQT